MHNDNNEMSNYKNTYIKNNNTDSYKRKNIGDNITNKK